MSDFAVRDHDFRSIGGDTWLKSAGKHIAVLYQRNPPPLPLPGSLQMPLFEPAPASVFPDVPSQKVQRRKRRSSAVTPFEATVGPKKIRTPATSSAADKLI